MRARFALGLASAIVVATSAITAPAADAAPAGEPCGFFQKWFPDDYAYYNHCGPTRVWIKVSRWVLPDQEKCVKPGITTLGTRSVVRNAWYIGRTC